ncbi:DUF2852 domain-containing protein [Thioclava sp. BHET1]|uniref:DUF2852 domain-containing protein n=1 Tax=Thioclava dalianensis TaxID=1185766 RepID=A0A074TGK6_9RHOB|nr:DUF2852 domain-containing protein [Thioclava dalianensis]KEP69235.1 hypothetical protein DL1_04910 [Thioclava dalianensis]TMV89221.1 DUF2852 domain-containing protein [Thioclava sp. BHET1]SFM72576.1 Protein of unknown function [Thioclava dalianensis]
MSAYATNTNAPAMRGNWFTRAIDWMDGNGPGAWIALMVAGFIFAGPLGLVLLAFILFTGRFGRRWRGGEDRMSRVRHRCGGRSFHMSRSTGNAAFDAYRTDTIERLEREQQEFEDFLRRLREARDKAEFDQYMEDRAKAAAESHDEDARAQN